MPSNTCPKHEQQQPHQQRPQHDRWENTSMETQNHQCVASPAISHVTQLQRHFRRMCFLFVSPASSNVTRLPSAFVDECLALWACLWGKSFSRFLLRETKQIEKQNNELRRNKRMILGCPLCMFRLYPCCVSAFRCKWPPCRRSERVSRLFRGAGDPHPPWCVNPYDHPPWANPRVDSRGGFDQMRGGVEQRWAASTIPGAASTKAAGGFELSSTMSGMIPTESLLGSLLHFRATLVTCWVVGEGAPARIPLPVCGGSLRATDTAPPKHIDPYPRELCTPRTPARTEPAGRCNQLDQ